MEVIVVAVIIVAVVVVVIDCAKTFAFCHSIKVALFIFPSFRLNDNGVITKRRNSSWNSYLVTVYAPHELWTVKAYYTARLCRMRQSRTV